MPSTHGCNQDHKAGLNQIAINLMRDALRSRRLPGTSRTRRDFLHGSDVLLITSSRDFCHRRFERTGVFANERKARDEQYVSRVQET